MNRILILLTLATLLISNHGFASSSESAKFAEFKKLQNEKLNKFKSDYLNRYEKHRAEIKEKWGVAELSSQTEFVQYDDNVKVIANFEEDFIEVSIQQQNDEPLTKVLNEDLINAVLSSLNVEPTNIPRHKSTTQVDKLVPTKSKVAQAKMKDVLSSLNVEPTNTPENKITTKVNRPTAIKPNLVQANAKVEKPINERGEVVEQIKSTSVLTLLGVKTAKQLTALVKSAEYVEKSTQEKRVIERTETRLEKQIQSLDNFSSSDAPAEQVKISEQLIASMKKEKKSLNTETSKEHLTAKKVTTYRLSLKRNRTHKAEPFLAAVNYYAKEWDVAPAIILAVMETESSFNPMAKSYIPAYGLMQIVPSTAGLDVNRKLFDVKEKPNEALLYTSVENIKYGSAYLHILMTRYLKEVKDPKSRLYCAIAAYNTGIGNLAKAFNKGKKGRLKAMKVINTMTPAQVYQVIKKSTHTETQRYLDKVLSSRDYFLNQQI
jgi:membrane-bound lytic murein transglycosylase C